MRLIKTFGLAAVAAVAAMAFVGATSASATSTQLCNTHGVHLAGGDLVLHASLTCGSAATGVSVTGSGTLLSNLVNVLCLNITASGDVLGLGNPQQIHVKHLLFTNCGTKSTHSNCTVTVLEKPLANLLKTGLDSGTLTGTNGLTLFECENIDIFGIDIHCVYDANGLQFAVGAQHLTADDTQLDKVSGSLCPDESFLDVLLDTAANRYVLA